MKGFLLAVSVFFLGLSGISYSETVDLAPIQDTYIRYYDDSDLNANFGSSEYLQVGNFSGNESTSFLLFDLSSFGSGAAINNATLCVFTAGNSVNTWYAENNPTIPEIGINQVNQIWNENTLTWSDVYSGSEFNFSVINNFFSTAPFDTESWLTTSQPPDIMEFDLTHLAQGWSGGDDNYGVALTALTGPYPPNSTDLISSNADPNMYPPRFPYLRVDYNAVPVPGTVLLLGSGLLGLAGISRKKQ